MPLAPIPLGPYDLRVSIGRGGMGEVWRAVYRPTNTPVAIKVMRPAASRRPDLVACFHREVRAAAALDHPNIAPVLDAGEVPAEVARRLGGRLAAGSPFLVTELALGSLAGATAPTSWGEVRPIVEDLLSALAHAHARGLTHRDLKPGNVLVAGATGAGGPGLPLDVGSLRGQERMRVMLADFGLAWTGREGIAEPDTASGTPAYMAPEQLDGRWRDIGPWTDMYGLGCLAWWLVAGRTPFRPRSIEAAMLHHQHRALPPLRALFPVPDGLESWLVRMLARDPSARFASAPDAQMGLRSLGDPNAARPTHAEPEDPDITLPIADASSRAGEPMAERPAVVPMTPRTPPMPARPLGVSRVRQHLVGTGLSLFGLRPPPFIGREAQREALWSELASARSDQRTRVVLIHGPAGTGTSRLAAWLCESAAVAGVAVPLRAVVTRSSLGLSELAAAHVRAAGLRGAALLGRVESWLGRRGYQDLHGATLIASLIERGEDALSERDRFEALRIMLGVEARARPVILWLDEAYASSSALALAERLLVAGGTLPVLVLVTARMDAMSRDPVALERLRGLLAAPLVREVAVGPLSPTQHRALVRQLLPLEPDLADRVEVRTAGNPRFAEQLLAAWIRANALVPGPQGFGLRPGAPEALPEEIHRAWAADLEERLAEVPPLAADCLALAALLGEPVDVVVWSASAAAAGLNPPPGLLTQLANAGLIWARPGTRGAFSFAHPMLREKLERGLAGTDRGAALHRACAEALGAGRSPGAAVRAGRHLLAGASADDAHNALLDRARHARRRGTCPEGLALLSLREQAMTAAGVPDTDARWGEGWLTRADLLLAALMPEEAERWASRVEASAQRHGWAELERTARRLLGMAAVQRGELDRARAALQDDFTTWDHGGALLAVASLQVAQGAFAEALARLDVAATLRRFEARPDPQLEAREMLLRGRIALASGQSTAARAALRRALNRYRALGNHLGEAWVLANLARVARAEGLCARAEGRLREAIALGEVAGSSLGHVLAVALAVTCLAQDRPDRARIALAGALDPLQRLGLEGDLARARLALAATAAFEGDWKTWERGLDECEAWFDLHGGWSGERLTLLKLVAARAVRQGDVDAAASVTARLDRLRATMGLPTEDADDERVLADRRAG